jgi:hypothetical protein
MTYTSSGQHWAARNDTLVELHLIPSPSNP